MAIAAWLMQLSVFLTPIFANQISIGYGVCKELAVVSTLRDLTPQTHHAHHAESTMMHDMPNMHGMMDMPQQSAQSTKPTKSTAATSQETPVKNVSAHGTSHDPQDHSQHGQCHFCLLFGHSVLPPVVTIVLFLAPVALTISDVKLRLLELLFIAQNKTLHPQSRAPPQFIL